MVLDKKPSANQDHLEIDTKRHKTTKHQKNIKYDSSPKEIICDNSDNSKSRGNEQSQSVCSDSSSKEIICDIIDNKKSGWDEQSQSVLCDRSSKEIICGSSDKDKSCDNEQGQNVFSEGSSTEIIRGESDNGMSYVNEQSKGEFSECLTTEIICDNRDNATTEPEPNQESKSEIWERYNVEFVPYVRNIREKMEDGEITATDAAMEFNKTLSDFLESKEEIRKETAKFFKHKPKSTKDIDQARQIKNKLRKIANKKGSTNEDKSEACKALRHYEYLLEQENRKKEVNEIKIQENAYKKDFFKFAKEITRGTYGKPTKKPTYTKEEADKFYSEKYSKVVNVNVADLEWFPEVTPPEVPYNLEPYNSEDIASAL